MAATEKSPRRKLEKASSQKVLPITAAKNSVVLGVTGSIAAYKSAELASLLVKQGHEVFVVMTHDAAQRRRWLVKKRRSEIRNARDALVWIVMKENEPPLAVEVQTEHWSLLFGGRRGPAEPACGRRCQHTRI